MTMHCFGDSFSDEAEHEIEWCCSNCWTGNFSNEPRSVSAILEILRRGIGYVQYE